MLEDCKSRLVKIRVVDNKKATSVKKAIVSVLRPLGATARHTLTTDNGAELAEHKAIESQLGMKVCFAHPCSSWERGTNKNTNGLIRQYFPKGMDLKKLSPAQRAQVERKLNNRPGKCLESPLLSNSRPLLESSTHPTERPTPLHFKFEFASQQNQNPPSIRQINGCVQWKAIFFMAANVTGEQGRCQRS